MKRPNWTESRSGTAFECVVKISAKNQASKKDLDVLPHKVSIVRPGQAQAKPCAPYTWFHFIMLSLLWLSNTDIVRDIEQAGLILASICQTLPPTE